MKVLAEELAADGYRGRHRAFTHSGLVLLGIFRSFPGPLLPGWKSPCIHRTKLRALLMYVGFDLGDRLLLCTWSAYSLNIFPISSVPLRPVPTCNLETSRDRDFLETALSQILRS